MVGMTERDWKTYLSKEDEAKLNDIIKVASKHREAYSKAENIKMAQLWCALLEMQKQQELLENRLNHLEDVFKYASAKMEEMQKIRESLDKF